MWVDTARKVNRNVKTGKTCPGLKICHLPEGTFQSFNICTCLHTIWALVRLDILKSNSAL